MNPLSDTESEPDQNAPIVESLEKTKPKRKGVAPTTPVAEEPKAPPKQKRQPTERQLEALTKAREKRALARKAKSENQPVEPKKEVKIETPDPEPPVVEKKKRTYNKKAKAPEPEPEPVVEKKKRTYNKKAKAPEPETEPPVVEKKKRTYKPKPAPEPKAEVAKIDFV
jgi:hypothetical protein